MTFQKKNNKETLDKLNDVSESFCLAKWTQVTLHLQIGHTHSCHHPKTHKIPIEEIEKDPSALHNTSYKKSCRNQMLVGERPAECDYCWNIEDVGQVSDRVHKSKDFWSMPYYNDVLKVGSKGNFNPKYLEVSFSNVCNFKCAYCAPHISSKWMEEIKEFGAYPTSTQYNNLQWLEDEDKMPIPHNKENLYVEAFWKWWPDLVKDLKVFRITGGEPLLSKDTWKVLDFLIENPQPNLEIGINTNLGIPRKLYEKFLEKVEYLSTHNCVKYVWIFTSVDTAGSNAEYIRHGLNYNQFMKNLDELIDLSIGKPILMSYMSTLNVLSPPHLKDFFEKVKEQKLMAGKDQLILDTPYLRHPEHLSLKILTEDFIDYMKDASDFLHKNKAKQNGVFFDTEIEKFDRIIHWMSNPASKEKLDIMRKDFYIFVNEHDRRRKTNFLKSCPEFFNFYKLCEGIVK